MLELRKDYQKGIVVVPEREGPVEKASFRGRVCRYESYNNQWFFKDKICHEHEAGAEQGSLVQRRVGLL